MLRQKTYVWSKDRDAGGNKTGRWAKSYDIAEDETDNLLLQADSKRWQELAE
jgi:hypothetical protein